MQTVTIGPDIVRTDNGRSFYPGQTYLISNETLRSMRDAELSTGFSLALSATNVISNWHYPQPAHSLLIWNTGRIGDQLWTTALIRAIKRRMPHVKIDVVVSGGQWEIWYCNKDIRGMREQPVPAAAIDDYDAVLFLDNVVADRTDKDQPNCYELLFQHTGITDYEESELRPHVHLTLEDERGAYQTIAKKDDDNYAFATQNHFILGLHSSSRSRNMPAPKWNAIIRQLEQLLAEAPDIKIYGISQNDFGGQLQGEIAKHKFSRYVELHNRLSFRQLAAMVRVARCVVSVDSMLVHLAAAFNTPCVPLMSTVPSEQRVGTYPFAVPLRAGEACPFAAECYWKYDGFRHRMSEDSLFAKCYTPQRTTCDILRAIKPADVISNMNLAIGRRIQFDNDPDFVFSPLPLSS